MLDNTGQSIKLWLVSRPNNTKQPFIVSLYPTNPTAPWKLEVRAYFAGKKIRRFFLTEADAWAEGIRLTEQIRTQGTNSLQQDVGGITMQVAVRMFLKEAEGKSKSHAEKIERICTLLEQRFCGPLERVTPLEVDRWLKSLKGSETSKAGIFRYARMFFRWAHNFRLISQNPMGGLRAPKAKPLRNILTPVQMQVLLQQEMPEWVFASLLLGGFAGLRTVEVQRMDWEDVDAISGQIHIRPEVIKNTAGFDQRIVDFTEPLAKRSDFFVSKEGTLVPEKITSRLFHYAREAVARAAGLDGWPDNALRHSFATYHLARCKSAPQTAYQMGHTSPAMVQRTYAVPAVRADWEAWWAL